MRRAMLQLVVFAGAGAGTFAVAGWLARLPHSGALIALTTIGFSAAGIAYGMIERVQR